MTDIRRRKRSWAAIVVAFVAVTLGGFRNRAWSEDVAPPSPEASSNKPATLEQRINQLDQKVRILERRSEVTQENDESKAKENVKPAAGSEGFSLKSADNAFALKFHALLQADARFFLDDKAGNETNSFLLRRVRPSIEATFYRDCNLVIVPDFANQ